MSFKPHLGCSYCEGYPIGYGPSCMACMETGCEPYRGLTLEPIDDSELFRQLDRLQHELNEYERIRK